jgi:hypothetical protein
MNAITDTGPPRCRATQSPGQETGIGVQNTRLTTGDTIKSRVYPQPDPDEFPASRRFQ